MSPSTDVYVAFGYDLGGEDSDEWRLEGLGKWGTFDDLELPWCPPNSAHHALDDAIETELRDNWLNYQKTPLKVLCYQHPDFAQFALVVAESVITYYHGHAAKVLTPAALSALSFSKSWELPLRSALDHLGLRPTQPHGEWLLMSYCA